jgi:hypothetical protein
VNRDNKQDERRNKDKPRHPDSTGFLDKKLFRCGQDGRDQSGMTNSNSGPGQNTSRFNWSKSCSGQSTQHPTLSKTECTDLDARGGCYNCKKTGHLSRNCPSTNVVKSNKKDGRPPGTSSYSAVINSAEAEELEQRVAETDDINTITVHVASSLWPEPVMQEEFQRNHRVTIELFVGLVLRSNLKLSRYPVQDWNGYGLFSVFAGEPGNDCMTIIDLHFGYQLCLPYNWAITHHWAIAGWYCARITSICKNCNFMCRCSVSGQGYDCQCDWVNITERAQLVTLFCKPEAPAPEHWARLGTYTLATGTSATDPLCNH